MKSNSDKNLIGLLYFCYFISRPDKEIITVTVSFYYLNEKKALFRGLLYGAVHPLNAKNAKCPSVKPILHQRQPL